MTSVARLAPLASLLHFELAGTECQQRVRFVHDKLVLSKIAAFSSCNQLCHSYERACAPSMCCVVLQLDGAEQHCQQAPQHWLMPLPRTGVNLMLVAELYSMLVLVQELARARLLDVQPFLQIRCAIAILVTTAVWVLATRAPMSLLCQHRRGMNTYSFFHQLVSSCFDETARASLHVRV